MYVYISDDALFIDYKNGAFGDPFASQDVIFQGNQPVRPEITQHGERGFDPLSPCLKAGKVVSQNTQDLGVMCREEVLEFLVGGKLTRSDRCESCREKGQEDVFPSPETA